MDGSMIDPKFLESLYRIQVEHDSLMYSRSNAAASELHDVLFEIRADAIARQRVAQALRVCRPEAVSYQRELDAAQRILLQENRATFAMIATAVALGVHMERQRRKA